MPSGEAQNTPNTKAEGDARAIEHLKQAVASGTYWYQALLEAIKLWSSAEEDYRGRHYCYLIDGEAFDWLLLAERLCEEISESIPEKERIDLLFFDRPPLELTKEKFKKLEIRKEQRALGLNRHADDLDKAYHRIYGDSQQALLDSFRKEKRHPKRKSTSLGELKEFTYWLFKYRLKICDKSRVASDTKKALTQMHHAAALKKVTPG